MRSSRLCFRPISAGGSTFIAVVSLTAMTVLLASGAALAEDEDGAANLWEALTGGRATLNLRGRVEVADTDARTQSEAYTLRTRLGYGTKPFYGFSVYADFEDITAIKKDQYWDLVKTDNGRTPIADPPATELNRAYLKFSRRDFLGSAAVVGRQRIKLDDDRFIGNVSWRQNEQTYIGALAQSSFGVDGLRLLYAYVWEVNRIFATAWDSSSHLVNLSYSRLDVIKVAGFGYFLDFNSSPGDSSDTIGIRIHGEIELGDGFSLAYQLSDAYQWDGGRDSGKNPTDYTANYLMADLNFGFRPIGALGAGYESLGSDDGKARFVTPLATAHKFNGWADVFVANGPAADPNLGLQDFYVYVSPRLPWGLEGKLVYHHFKTDEGGATLGNEFDARVGKGINKNFDVLAKVAYFNAAGNGAGHTVRGWLQAVLQF